MMNSTLSKEMIIKQRNSTWTARYTKLSVNVQQSSARRRYNEEIDHPAEVQHLFAEVHGALDRKSVFK